ncbi:MAG: phenylalanine--tRNA ligase subunit alpha [Acidobacteriota bacterium]|jgi:phenylalanyl-tRNA synthetase alpha chain|nr:phenylalanine--tRNA ligase subunit alpha [Acidobacteriota bacterium]
MSDTSDTRDTFEGLRQDFGRDCAAITGMDSWKEVRDKYLAREGGRITVAMKQLRTLPKDEKPLFGQRMNELRSLVESRLEELLQTVKSAEAAGKGGRIDVTRPGFPFVPGSAHPIKRLQAEIEQIFVSMGFQIHSLPEIETDYYNFEALNMPRNHPARDAQDTFYFDDTVLLRTHCSSVQPHSLEGMTPPVRAISTGKVYRRDPFDATHSPMFYQVDVVAVEKGLTMGDLKGTLNVFLQRIFNQEIKMRLRPGFFPFVEPGAEVDISCIFCGGKGCPTCKGSGWIEILGAGMIHPKVLRMSGIDDSVYSGFAWGMGIDRVAILKYGVDDIRLFFENDLRFLQQF